MAIARTSPLIGAISGALNSTIFAQTRNGLVIKHRPRKINRRTEKQLAHRALFATVNNYWHQMDTQTHDAWKDAATNAPSINRLSLKSNTSPRSLFVGQNMLTLFGYDHLSTTPEHNTQAPPLVAATIDWTAGGAYNVSITDPDDWATLGRAYGARSFSLTENPSWTPKTWTFLGSVFWLYPDAIDFSIVWNELLGPPVQNERVAIKIILYPLVVFWPPGPPRTFVINMK